MVGGESKLNSCPCKLSTHSKISANGFGLSCGTDARADDGHNSRSRDLIDNIRATRGMYGDATKVEFFCKTDGGENVVTAMRVNVHRDLALEHRDQSLVFCIKNIIALFLFSHISLGFNHSSAEDCGDSHTGHGSRSARLAVITLRIFAHSAFHCRGSLDDHIRDIFAVKLNSGGLTTDDVCASGAGVDGGNTRASSLGDSNIKGIKAVHYSHIGGNGIGGFIAVLALPTLSFLGNTDVGVRVDHTGEDESTLGIKDITAPRRGVCKCTEADDLAVFDVNVTVLIAAAFNCMKQTVLYTNHNFSPYWGITKDAIKSKMPAAAREIIRATDWRFSLNISMSAIVCAVRSSSKSSEFCINAGLCHFFCF